jgi:hypothetical protein
MMKSGTGTPGIHVMTPAERAVVYSSTHLMMKRSLELAGIVAKHRNNNYVSESVLTGAMRMLVSDPVSVEIGSSTQRVLKRIWSGAESKDISEIESDLIDTAQQYINCSDTPHSQVIENMMNQVSADGVTVMDDEKEEEGAMETDADEDMETVLKPCSCEVCAEYDRSCSLSLDDMLTVLKSRGEDGHYLQLVLTKLMTTN